MATIARAKLSRLSGYTIARAKLSRLSGFTIARAKLSRLSGYNSQSLAEQVVASVGAGRSPRRQMRRYLPCGERFVMSLATVAKTKTRCFHNTYES